MTRSSTFKPQTTVFENSTKIQALNIYLDLRVKLLSSRTFALLWRMRKLFQSETMENFFTVAKPFLSVANVLGVFPMSFEGSPRNGIIKHKWKDLFVLLFVISIQVFLISTQLSLDLSFIKNSKNLHLAWKTATDIEMLSYCFLSFYQVLKRKRVLKFLQAIHKIDETAKVCIFKFSLNILIFFSFYVGTSLQAPF